MSDQPRPIMLAAGAALVMVSGILIAYSQRHAYTGDESFHLLAAKLISAGRVPYGDFFYQHPPLFVYIVAGIFRIAGVGWRVVHVCSSMLLAGACGLAAVYARGLFAEQKWGWLNALAAAVLLGLNSYAVVFGTTGLPFAFCIFCMTAALVASRSQSVAGLVATGLFSGASAAASFLTAPAFIVLQLWVTRRDKKRALWSIGGALVAFLPLLFLLAIEPGQTLLDTVKYHFTSRPNLGWRFNLRETTAFVVSVQGIILIGPAVGAVLRRNDPEVRLCAWIALSTIVGIAAARTTAVFYFIVVVPFMAVLAGTGLIEIARRLRWSATGVVSFSLAAYLIGLQGLIRGAGIDAPYMDHRQVGALLTKVKLCRQHANLWAPEAVYFENEEMPPRGMENRFDPFSSSSAMLRERRADVVVISPRDPLVARFGLARDYSTAGDVQFDRYSMRVLCRN